MPPKGRRPEDLDARIAAVRTLSAGMQHARPPTLMLCGAPQGNKPRLTQLQAADMRRTKGFALAATHMSADFVMRGAGVDPGMLVIGVNSNGVPVLPSFSYFSQFTVAGALRVSQQLQREPPVGCCWSTQAVHHGRIFSVVAVVAWPPNAPYYAYSGMVRLIKKLRKQGHPPYVLLPELCGMPWTDSGSCELFRALKDSHLNRKDALAWDMSAWCAQAAL